MQRQRHFIKTDIATNTTISNRTMISTWPTRLPALDLIHALTDDSLSSSIRHTHSLLLFMHKYKTDIPVHF